MNRGIIKSINDVVTKEDSLWILGDLFFKSDLSQRIKWLNAINCKNINVIEGNHDRTTQLRDLHDLGLIRYFPEKILQVCEKDSLLKIVLCHYPIYSWNAATHGAWHLFGHTHSNFTGWKGRKAMNVGWDIFNRPISFGELHALFSQQDLDLGSKKEIQLQWKEIINERINERE